MLQPIRDIPTAFRIVNVLVREHYEGAEQGQSMRWCAELNGSLEREDNQEEKRERQAMTATRVIYILRIAIGLHTHRRARLFIPQMQLIHP